MFLATVWKWSSTGMRPLPSRLNADGFQSQILCGGRAADGDEDAIALDRFGAGAFDDAHAALLVELGRGDAAAEAEFDALLLE